VTRILPHILSRLSQRGDHVLGRSRIRLSQAMKILRYTEWRELAVSPITPLLRVTKQTCYDFNVL
jgi:hypothetical protein